MLSVLFTDLAFTLMNVEWIRTAQGCWKMLTAYDKDNAGLREKPVAAKFVIK